MRRLLAVVSPLLALGALLSALSGATTTDAQGYTVEGHLTATSKLSPTGSGTVSEKGFRVEVSGSRYTIRVWKHGETPEYTEYSYIDGTMYTLYHQKARFCKYFCVNGFLFGFCFLFL